MRILHTESSKGWGGQENRTLNEMIGLRSLGHDVAVVGQPGARILDRATEERFETFAIPMRNGLDISAIFGFRQLIRDYAADIVNVHSSRDTQLAGMAALTLGRHRPRIIRTRHLALPITSRFTYSVLPDHVVTVSHFVGRYLVAAGVPQDMITVVPTGIDLTLYQSNPAGGSLRAELGLPKNALMVGTVAILRRKKGHLELLEAIPNVLSNYPDVHFIFAGDGPIEHIVRSKIEEAGLTDRVHLLGLRRDVANVLQSLDIFVLPTHQEALGTAFIEAAAMGVAAIGTRVDGVPEVIVDGETGLLVPVLDISALSDAICRMLGDAALRLTMGQCASHRVRCIYSRENMATSMAKVYSQQLLDR